MEFQNNYQQNVGGSSGTNESGLGSCASKEMTKKQIEFANYIDGIKDSEDEDFSERQTIKFGELFKLRGMLGQGTYGVVVMVQDRLLLVNEDKVETYALKIINKAVLHAEEINIIRGESKILHSLVGLPNVVQFINIFETSKFIIIQMEHLKGNPMKREIKFLLSEAKKVQAEESDNSDNDKDKKDQKKAESDDSSIFNKFDNPFKFWQYQLSFEEN